MFLLHDRKYDTHTWTYVHMYVYLHSLGNEMKNVLFAYTRFFDSKLLDSR